MQTRRRQEVSEIHRLKLSVFQDSSGCCFTANKICVEKKKKSFSHGDEHRGRLKKHYKQTQCGGRKYLKLSCSSGSSPQARPSFFFVFFVLCGKNINKKNLPPKDEEFVFGICFKKTLWAKSDGKERHENLPGLPIMCYGRTQHRETYIKTQKYWKTNFL